MDRAVFERLAAMFRYPEEGCVESAVAVQHDFDVASTEAAARLRPWTDWVRGSGLEEVQEQFLRSFDMNPSGCAEIGWHLFGENYERGELMVELRAILRELGVEESQELPDHLCHVLPVLARDRAGDATPLARRFVAPAIEKMLAGHPADGPIHALLDATHALVVACFGEPIAFESPNPPPGTPRGRRHLPVMQGRGGRVDA
jgi:nitrate reductase molybdenum cofactor assembly chaperone NarJ/NarW